MGLKSFRRVHAESWSSFQGTYSPLLNVKNTVIKLFTGDAKFENQRRKRSPGTFHQYFLHDEPVNVPRSVFQLY